MFETTSLTCRYVEAQEYVAIEPYIAGKYEKFNSNGGYEDQNLSSLLRAFSHWTWEISGHNYMVCNKLAMCRLIIFNFTDHQHSLKYLSFLSFNPTPNRNSHYLHFDKQPNVWGQVVHLNTEKNYFSFRYKLHYQKFAT